MNITQLQHFVETVRQGSYAAASKILFISAPGISRSVGELEKELGIKLVERSGKTVAPTKHGQLLYGRAVTILENVNNFLGLAEALSEGEETQRSILLAAFAIPYRGSVVSDRLLDLAKQNCATMNISIVYNPSASCLAALEAGLVDAAIVLGNADKIWAVSSRLFSVKPRIALACSHPLCNRKELRLKDLSDYPIARPNDWRYCFNAIDGELRRALVDPVYQDIPFSEQSHIDFLQNEQGLIFVAYNENLSELYPDALFLDVSDMSLSIPIYLAARREIDRASMQYLKKGFTLAARKVGLL